MVCVNKHSQNACVDIYIKPCADHAMNFLTHLFISENTELMLILKIPFKKWTYFSAELKKRIGTLRVYEDFIVQLEELYEC